jgi:general secretion pathway protein M
MNTTLAGIVSGIQMLPVWRTGQAWYRTKDPRDQRVIQILVAATLLTIIWLGIWKPVSDWRDVQKNRLENARTTLEWMKLNEIRAREVAAAQASEAGDRALLPMITRSAAAAGLALTRVQPEADNAVSITLQNQGFEAVIRWLNQLEQNNGVVVSRVAFDVAGPGRVNAQLRLQ